MSDEKLPGTKAIVQRAYNADKAYDEALMERAGITAAQAAKVRELHLKKRIAKRDWVGGRINVTHGAFLEKDAILNALDLANGKAKWV